MAALRTNNGLTIAELARSIGVTTRSIERNLQKLQDKGRLRRVGSDRGGRWEIVE